MGLLPYLLASVPHCIRLMADHPSDNPPASGLPSPPAERKRVHTYGRLTTAAAVLALATAAYSLWRLDAARDRLDELNQIVAQVDSDRTVLRGEIKSLANSERLARNELKRRLDALDEAPKQLQEFGTALEELRGRAEGPERAWSRAEASFLMELAQRRLTLDRDIDTAIVALESADSRLASLRDPSVGAVRQQVAKEVQALRAVSRPDVAGILGRLTNAEEEATLAKVLGIVAVERTAPANVLPEGFFSRAWAVARNAISGLISVRKVEDRGASVLTQEEQSLRRQHLQLLLYSARAAVPRHDSTSYRSSLAGARQWLNEFFDLTDPATAALLREVQALEAIDIDPPLPDVTGSARALQRLMPARRGTP